MVLGYFEIALVKKRLTDILSNTLVRGFDLTLCQQPHCGRAFCQPSQTGFLLGLHEGGFLKLTFCVSRYVISASMASWLAMSVPMKVKHFTNRKP